MGFFVFVIISVVVLIAVAIFGEDKTSIDIALGFIELVGLIWLLVSCLAD